MAKLLRSMRRTVRDQLESDRTRTKNLSFTNWILVFVILLSMVLYTVETEHEFRTSQAGTFGLLNDMVLWIFGAEFVLRIWSAGADA